MKRCKLQKLKTIFGLFGTKTKLVLLDIIIEL